jgi:hypothetical protein
MLVTCSVEINNSVIVIDFSEETGVSGIRTSRRCVCS